MSIPRRFLDEIRNRLTLSEVIGQRISVMRAGREHKACCPFHKEKTPSFTINDQKQFYHCFGCGAHGDVISFVSQHDNLSFPDAVEMLAAQAGLQMPKPDPQEAKKAQKAKTLHDAVEQATRWFQAQLHDSRNQDVLAYIRGRGFSDQTLENFRIGYAPADPKALGAHLKSLGFDDSLMIEAGLLKPSKKGGDPYAFFRDRLVVPVNDKRGRPVAFGGRVLPESIRPVDPTSSFTPPKYMNSSDTPLFDKGRMVFAESQARQAARDDQPVIVTEGYMDVMACHQAGFTGAVAPMGTALTEDQILLLWQMIPADQKLPILCFDGDNAGRRAAMRACERAMPLLSAGRSVKIAFMPDGEDPDSILQSQGRKGFQQFLDNSLSLFDFIWLSHTEGRDFSTPESKAGLKKNLLNFIGHIQDAELQRLYKQQIYDRFNQTFYKRRSASSFSSQNQNARLQQIKPRRPAFRDMHGRIFLAALINHPGIFHDIEEEIGGFVMGHPQLDRLRQAIIAALCDDEGLDRERLCNHLTHKGFERELHGVLSESVYVHAPFCAPPAKDAGIDLAALAQKWLALWHDLQVTNAQREMKGRWQSVIQSEDQAGQDQLIYMAKMDGQGKS